MRETDDGGTDDERVTGWVGSRVRLLAVAGGAGLVGSYLLPWVRVTGETRGSGAPGTISAAELELLPEVAVALGVGAGLVAAVRWTTPVHLAVLVAGLVTTGIALFARSFPDSDADVIELGGYAGPPGAFEPTLGTTIALVAALVLVGTGFVGLLSSLQSQR